VERQAFSDGILFEKLLKRTSYKWSRTLFKPEWYFPPIPSTVAFYFKYKMLAKMATIDPVQPHLPHVQEWTAKNIQHDSCDSCWTHSNLRWIPAILMCTERLCRIQLPTMSDYVSLERVDRRHQVCIAYSEDIPWRVHQMPIEKIHKLIFLNSAVKFFKHFLKSSFTPRSTRDISYSDLACSQVVQLDELRI
jgi:hypothetical protein